METLCRLFLELSQVVPEGTRTCREIQYELAIKTALKRLDNATPQQRNGPVYRAADALREVIGLPPMTIGGKPSEGLEP